MKRDMELARKILEQVEEKSKGVGVVTLEIPDFSPEDISYNVMLLTQAGLLKSNDCTSGMGLLWVPRTLTWTGHEFLDAIRNDTVWNKVKDMRYCLLLLALVLSGCQSEQPGQQGSVDWLARIIAVVGVTVAVGGLALGIRNYFWDRRKFEIMRKERIEDKEERKKEKDEEAKAKAEQNKERVIADLSIMGIMDAKKEPRYVWSVRIYNPTGIVIPLKNFTLTFIDHFMPKRNGKHDTKSIDLKPRQMLNEGITIYGPGENPYQPQLFPELEPRKEIVCKTLPFSKCIVEDIASHAAIDVDISIYSHTGVMECIKGDVIIAKCKDALATPIQ